MAVPVPCVWQDTLRPWAFPLLYVLFLVPAVQQLSPPHGLPEAQAAVTGGQFLLQERGQPLPSQRSGQQAGQKQILKAAPGKAHVPAAGLPGRMGREQGQGLGQALVKAQGGRGRTQAGGIVQHAGKKGRAVQLG